MHEYIKWCHPYPQPPCATAQRRPLLQCEPLHRCYMFLLLVHSEISAQHECKPSHLQIDTNSKIKALFWNKAFNILQKKGVRLTYAIYTVQNSVMLNEAMKFLNRNRFPFQNNAAAARLQHCHLWADRGRWYTGTHQ